MTIQETQELVKVWEEKNNTTNNQLTNLALLTESMGELTRIIAKGYGHDKISKAQASELSKKIGEIVWRTMSIANQSQVEVCQAVIDTLESKNKTL